MAPVSAAEKAALDAFFKGKRGERKLIEPVAEALISYLYFAGKGNEELERGAAYWLPCKQSNKLLHA